MEIEIIYSSKNHSKSLHRCNKLNRKFFIILITLSVLNTVYARHLHKEREYQHAWCKLNNGIEEYKNRDYTRVDCLTNNYAVEFDFAPKWAESVGQTLYYKMMTGHQGKVVLIVEDKKREMVYFKRVEALSKIYDFEVEYVTDKILKRRRE